MLVKRVSRRKHRLCVLKANDELHAVFFASWEFCVQWKVIQITPQMQLKSIAQTISITSLQIRPNIGWEPRKPHKLYTLNLRGPTNQDN